VTLVSLTPYGVRRVLEGAPGMTFAVEHFTDAMSYPERKVAHVRDYRFGPTYQVWSLGPEDYVIIWQGDDFHKAPCSSPSCVDHRCVVQRRSKIQPMEVSSSL
jgi:hypothetical protein